ncbi:MAG: UbiA prenyltransferase family protein [Bacteroidota bacterium]
MTLTNQFKQYLKLIRYGQWSKNLFILLPAFFSFKILDASIHTDLIVTFFAFSFLASAVYVFNDILDIENDQLHPTKKLRPLAAGLVNKTEGYFLIAVLLSLSCLLFLWQNKPEIMLVAALYLVQNFFYCIKLKHVSLLDVMIIATGFVLRILIGGYAADVKLSHWIILMTLVLAIFLALAKRRDDVFVYLNTNQKSRKNLDGYNMEFLNVALTIMSTVVIVCYLMYCTSPDITSRFGHNTYLTSFFVILGVLRYLQLTFVWMITGSPTKVFLTNRFLQLILLGWVLSFFLIIYIEV